MENFKAKAGCPKFNSIWVPSAAQRTGEVQHLHKHPLLTMETQQILLPLPCWVHLDDTDWETVGGSSKHSRGQSVVIFIQKLCKGNGERHFDLHQIFFKTAFKKLYKRTCGATWSISQELSPTLQCVLLHLNFIELVGSNDDAVSGQMDAAARLRGFNLLEKRTAWTDMSPLYQLTDNTESRKLCIATFIFTKGRGSNLKDPSSLSKACEQKLFIKSFVLLEVMLECRLAYQLASGEILFLLEEYTVLEDIFLLCSSDF